MHGMGEMIIWTILVGVVCGFIVASFTGARTSVSAVWGVIILAIIAATLDFLSSDSIYTAVVFLPMTLALCVIGLIGALPGAAFGGMVRSKFVKEK